MTTQELRYLAYMLRLWQVHDRDKITWRASLEDAHTGERRGFASPGLLFEFLKQLAGDEDEFPRRVPPASKSD